MTQYEALLRLIHSHPDEALAVLGIEELADILLALDPRKERSVALARRVAAVRASGVSINNLCDRFGLSPARIKALLKISRGSSFMSHKSERLLTITKESGR